MRLDIVVRSSGPGPRKPVGVPTIANAYWRRVLLETCFKVIGQRWPCDGVAVIIRRAP